ncbi:MAG: glycosyl transferase [Gammaproteobacteria bacterium]|nr:glycosyl transferase [Gammaproteobacteria bacterium]
MGNEFSDLDTPVVLRVAIYVQHLLGTGHLVRMMALASALTKRNHHVVLLSGGEIKQGEYPGYEQVQLPIAKTAPGNFKQLLNGQGCPVDERWKKNRAKQLLALVMDFVPQVLIVETFPFGRRQMRFELLPLLDAVKAMDKPPLVISSIRDILQARAPKRNQESVDLLRSYFDGVLVHSDPKLVPLSASFPLSDRIEPLVHYSGYIAQSNQVLKQQEGVSTGRDGFGEVIVSAGGGAVGLKLLLTAIEAKPFCSLKNARWRILIGKNLHRRDADLLRTFARDDIIVEKNRSDFQLLLGRCELSISQAGYNSCLDIIHAGVRSVMVPFSSDGETEQLQRAKLFSEKGLSVLVEEPELTIRTLCDAINEAMMKSVPTDFEVKSNGAQQSARFIEELSRKCR